MYFKQIQQHGDNFSYIIADEDTGDGAVVDSSYNAGKIMQLIEEQKLNLKFIINTHGHSDHTAGNTELRSKFNAKTVSHALSMAKTDLKVNEGDIINVGKNKIRVIHTPGHTQDSICLLINEQKLLTGDTLFVGECGRTDLPGGNPRSMYESLFGKLTKLDDKIEVYPGHDYGNKPSSTIGEEKKTNYVLRPRSQDEFVKFMHEP